MIGEASIDGVFVPQLLLLGILAFVLTACARRVLRSLRLYRFVWHAGLFDMALFLVLLWILALLSAVLMPYGLRAS
jgi:hypothetical protein